MASTNLNRTPSSASNRKTWTWSGWVKKSTVGSTQVLFQGGDSGFPEKIVFTASDILEYDYDIAGTDYTVFVTDRVFRDTNAWYHIVVAKDTTQATETDRIKIYVNGEQQSLSEYQLGYPPQNHDGAINNTVEHCLGSNSNGGEFFGGIMSHVHLVDGTALAPTVFGSTDSTTGEWKINTSPSVTYGTNGFFMFKDDNSLNDDSGNGNNFALEAGTLTKTEDNPSNVFATFNTLSGAQTMAVNSTFANGNNKVTCGGTVYAPFGSTIGVNSGKYYAEFKIKSAAADGMIGIFAKNGTSNSHYLGNLAYQYCWYNDSGRIIGNNANIQTGVGQYTTNDIIGIALDCTNNKLYFHKNGTYITNGSGTGNPSSGTYGYSITDPASTDLGFYFMAAMDWGGSTRAIWEANFGNGYFGTTAVSSAGTNASNNGIFEYDVPTGYTALSTKGLNT